MVSALDGRDPATAYDVARTVTDPEMPMLTLEDLGVLRGVEERDGAVVVAITPTYSGCPAMATMRDDLVHRLTDAGYADVRVEVELEPAWSSDWITERGRAALRRARHLGARRRADAGTARSPSTCCPPAARSPARAAAPPAAELTSEFGPTACKALYRCADCLEPFEHVKEI